MKANRMLEAHYIQATNCARLMALASIVGTISPYEGVTEEMRRNIAIAIDVAYESCIKTMNGEPDGQ